MPRVVQCKEVSIVYPRVDWVREAVTQGVLLCGPSWVPAESHGQERPARSVL